MNKLFINLTLISISLLLSCTDPNSTEEMNWSDFPEIIEVVNGPAYRQFTEDFNHFINELDRTRKDLLTTYIERALQKPLTLSASCNCDNGDRSCSASGWFSDCCICCSSSRAAVCGTYFGIASCRCEDLPQPRLQNEGDITGVSKVMVYPQNIAKFIKQANNYGINTVEIQSSFLDFIKSI
ncbi:MAG: hypothetical protein L6Q51_02385 [Cyclobacteriaceae bacterium]|nr:hypothetical protein [Cyclobacteriaceae bacterium]QOI97148.1 MAG: hypothetical protein HRU69_06425 [Flammeovirgaceae bacterium]